MVVDVNSKLILYLSNNLKKLLKSPSLIVQKNQIKYCKFCNSTFPLSMSNKEIIFLYFYIYGFYI